MSNRNAAAEAEAQANRAIAFGRFTQVIYVVLSIVDGMLLIRLLLNNSANTQNALVSLLFDITDVLVSPFMGLTTATEPGPTEFVIAIIAYSILTTLIVNGLTFIFIRR